jgi:hypothetical protein
MRGTTCIGRACRCGEGDVGARVGGAVEHCTDDALVGTLLLGRDRHLGVVFGGDRVADVHREILGERHECVEFCHLSAGGSTVRVDEREDEGALMDGDGTRNTRVELDVEKIGDGSLVLYLPALDEGLREDRVERVGAVMGVDDREVVDVDANENGL